MATQHSSKNQKGFTLVELLIVIALLGILAAISMSIINYQKHLGNSRNTRRRLELHTISMAIYNYTTDTGFLPAAITSDVREICRTNAPDCTGLVDLSVLTTNTKYLTTIPVDPSSTDMNSTGYSVYRTPCDRITVIATNAENEEVIEVTR